MYLFCVITNEGAAGGCLWKSTTISVVSQRYDEGQTMAKHRLQVENGVDGGPAKCLEWREINVHKIKDKNMNCDWLRRKGGLLVQNGGQIDDGVNSDITAQRIWKWGKSFLLKLRQSFMMISVREMLPAIIPPSSSAQVTLTSVHLVSFYHPGISFKKKFLPKVIMTFL